MATYGVTATGFVQKQQSVIISEISASLQQAFGVNINLLPEAVFGQLIGIFSEQLSEVWQLNEAVYDSSYPSGAEGTSVDNILALSNLRRLGARPTVTSPIEAGIPGLVLYGTPGTFIDQGSIITVEGAPTIQFTLDAAVTIGSAVNAVQSVLFTAVPDSGSFELVIIDPDGNTVTSQVISYLALAANSQILFGSAPISGAFTIGLTQAGVTLTTGSIPYTANAAAVQTAIRLLSGYSAVVVTGSFAAGFVINWGSITIPKLSTGANTLGVSVTNVDSVQSAINELHDATASKYPYTDVTVSGSYGSGFVVSFGANSPLGSNPSSGSQPQAVFSTTSNSLQISSTVVNISNTTSTAGLKAQAVGSATCTENGPNFVPANSLNVIGTPVTGWDSVTNPLDCVTGSNVESDTAALARRDTLLAENANGPLQATVAKVSLVSGVTSVIGNQNLGLAAWEIISFSAIPITGSFTIQINGTTTSAIPYTADAAAVQAALNALAGYSTAIVRGSFLAGFTIDFNGANGGAPQALATIPSNSLGVTVSVNYGLPGKSIQIIAAGGTIPNIARAIYGSNSGGIQTYGDPVKVTGDVAIGFPTISNLSSIVGLEAGMVVAGAGIPIGTTILTLTGNTATMSQNATANGTTEALAFTDTYYITDDATGSQFGISFQRPTVIPVYVTIHLVTDLFVNGVANPSPKFNVGSIPTIQQDVVTIGNEVKIGGLIIGFGTNGLIGAFNNVPGINQYTLKFALSASPTGNDNIPLPPSYQALFETFNVIVSYV